MSKDDIEKAVKDAERYAAEDKKRREEVDVKNEAENLCYSVEKLVKDGEGKIEASDKDNLTQKVTALRETIKSGNVENIKKDMEELKKNMYDVSTKLYQQAAPQGEAAGQQQSASNGSAQGSENVYNADYKDVNPENK